MYCLTPTDAWATSNGQHDHDGRSSGRTPLTYRFLGRLRRRRWIEVLEVMDRELPGDSLIDQLRLEHDTLGRASCLGQAKRGKAQSGGSVPSPTAPIQVTEVTIRTDTAREMVQQQLLDCF